MSRDVECPNCEKWQEVNHDDGQNYEEDELHLMECNDCDQTFGFWTIHSIDYEAVSTPCKNDGEHIWEHICGVPKEYFEKRYRCDSCQEEKEFEQPPV